jgi:hypothetical protein
MPRCSSSTSTASSVKPSGSIVCDATTSIRRGTFHLSGRRLRSQRLQAAPSGG